MNSERNERRPTDVWGPAGGRDGAVPEDPADARDAARPDSAGARRRRVPGWLWPALALALAAVAVWWYVSRESPDERGARLIAEARRAMEAQDFPTAENRLLAALKLAPANGVLLHNLGVLYSRQNRLPEARSAFERALAAHGPEASEVRAEELFQMATISYAEKKYAQAADELGRAIAAHPTRAQLHSRLLDLQLGRLSDPTAADSTTARYLRLCGRTPRNLGDAAFVHYQHQSYAAAAVLSRQAVALEDSFVEGHALLARTLWKEGNPHGGLQVLQGPLARYPRAAPLWVVQSLLLGELGRRTDALAAADRAVALAPREYEPHQARQKALANFGRLDEALEEIEVARELTQDPGEQRMLLRQQRIVRGLLAQSKTGVLSSPGAADSGEAKP